MWMNQLTTWNPINPTAHRTISMIAIVVNIKEKLNYSYNTDSAKMSSLKFTPLSDQGKLNSCSIAALFLKDRQERHVPGVNHTVHTIPQRDSYRG